GVVAAHDGAHVEPDDVALLEGHVVGDAVHHHVVHRHAERRGIAAIALERRLSAVIAHELLGLAVELARRHARSHEALQMVQAPGDDARAPANRGDLLLAAEVDHPSPAPSAIGSPWTTRSNAFVRSLKTASGLRLPSTSISRPLDS